MSSLASNFAFCCFPLFLISLWILFPGTLFILYIQVQDSTISEAELSISKLADYINVRNKMQLFTFYLYF